MAVGIGRSIREGFRAANKSWAGIGVVIGVWIILAIIGLVGISLTNPPAGLGEQAGIPVADIPSPPAATTTEETPAPAEEATLFTELETAEEAAPAAPEAVAPPAGDDAEERPAQDKEQEEQNRLVQEWLGRAWPVLLVGVLLFVAVSIWLLGGQIGYLAQRVTTQQSSLSQFWASGARAFWPFLGAFALLFLVYLGLMLFFTLLLSLVGSVVWLSMLVQVGARVGLVWAMMYVLFWFIAIVADRLGPIRGFLASVRTTRGRWWRVCGLAALWLLMSIGAVLGWYMIVLLVVSPLGNTNLGVAGTIMIVIGSPFFGIGITYLNFASTAAYIRFYEDAKAVIAGASPVGV